MKALTAIVVILVAFTIGYKVISWLMDRLKGPQTTADSNAQGGADAGPRNDGGFRATDAEEPRGSAEDARSRDYEDPETRYAKVLDLPRNFTAPEIKERFRQLIAQYHPDKVSHLGPDLRDMANRKTREILEAYDYFRVKYNLK